MPYLYEPFELQVLGDFLHTGSQSEGTVWKPTPQSGKAELESNQVGEVVFVEIFPPVTTGGVAEALENIILVLDGKPYGDYINLIGTDTHNFCPPLTNAMNGQILAFGTPLVNVVKGRGVSALLEGICPKFNKTVTIEARAGAGGISADYRIRLWGYRYPAQELDRLIGKVGGMITLFDDRTNRKLSLKKDTVQATWETWTQLPGGLDQAPPKIFPLVRYAKNAKATTPNTPYQFRHDTGDVATREEDLYFPFDIEEKVLVIKGLGVRAPAHLKETFLNIDGKDRPRSRIPTTQFNNPLHFGRAYPLLPNDVPLYYTIPKFDRRYMIWHDKGYVACQDDGTQITANQIVVALNGVYIEIGALPRGM
ncbi:MAG: hypothetical protein ACUVRO_09900 [Armatimonadota bacterium]